MQRLPENPCRQLHGDDRMCDMTMIRRPSCAHGADVKVLREKDIFD